MRVNGKRWGQALVVILVLTGLAANAEQTAQGENTQLQTQKLEADIKQLQIELQQLKTTKEVFDEKARGKLEGEIAKLIEETKGLKSTNDALDSRTKWLTAWVAAIGSLSSVFVAILLWFFGHRLNRTQQSKLEQDKELELKKHILEVFQNLGDKEPRLRIGAAALLIQRLERLHTQNNQSGSGKAQNGKTNPVENIEQEDLSTIVSVLISVTKYERREEIQKYIADGLAKALNAMIPPDQAGPTEARSPLEPYDFQGAKLGNAWWKRIDARKVDFYEAHLVRAGLREAFLSGTILKKADLSGATLVKASLIQADLQGATMRQTILTDANLSEANLRGADLTRADLSRAKLDGADLRGATLQGAIIEGTDFGAANITGVDLSQTKSDAHTELSRTIKDKP